MATLPDLDTTQIGYIAYWNAIDQGGVSDIEPDDVLSEGAITDYTLYDNGVAGKMNSIVGRTVNFRVKEDGWMVTYIDRTNNFNSGTDISTEPRGYWDVANRWEDVVDNNNGGHYDTSAASITDNTLAAAIDTLRQNLSNSGSLTFDYADVGLHNYEYPTSTNTTLLSSQEVSSDSPSFTPGFSYTEGTTLNYVAATGATGADYETGNHYVDFEGVRVAEVSGADASAYGTLDPLAQGLIPNAGTEYQHTIQLNMSNAIACLLALWE